MLFPDRRLACSKGSLDGFRIVVEFFGFGPYGAFVWAAYGITAVLMVGLAVQSVMAARNRAGEADELRATLKRDDAPKPAIVAKRTSIADMQAKLPQ